MCIFQPICYIECRSSNGPSFQASFWCGLKKICNLAPSLKNYSLLIVSSYTASWRGSVNTYSFILGPREGLIDIPKLFQKSLPNITDSSIRLFLFSIKNIWRAFFQFDLIDTHSPRKERKEKDCHALINYLSY